jgi:predicted PurR-regulated permease PerM
LARPLLLRVGTSSSFLTNGLDSAVSLALDPPSDLTFSETAKVQEAAQNEPATGWPLVILASIAVVGALYWGRDLIIPILLALLLSLLLRPILRRMKKLGVPDIVSSFVIVAFVAAIFAGSVFSLIGQATYWLSAAPEKIEQVRRMVSTYPGPMEDLAKATEAVRHLTQPETESTPMPVVVQSHEATYTLLGTSGHIAGSAIIVFVLAFFLLSFSDTLLKQAVESRPSFSQKRNVVELLYNVENGISRYLATITIINIGLGVVTGLMLWLLGIPNPILWGVMVATLNYVPHVGAFACLAVLFVVGAVTQQSLAWGVGIAVMFSVLTSAESYLVTPLVLSRSLQLSPLAVILFVFFFGWLWGIIGGLMAAPLLAVLKIICDQFESLQPWGMILAGKSARS